MTEQSHPYRALITGASRGIGQAIVNALADRCAHLFLVGRDAVALEEVQRSIPQTPVTFLVGDVRDQMFIDGLGAEVLKNGGINLLINNAGLGGFFSFEHQEDWVIRDMVEVNLLAPILLTRALLPVLKQSSYAQIINIGSAIGYIGYPGFVTYCATKFGIRGFTEALGRELADGSVRVRLFSPRSTNTQINPPALRQLNEQLGATEDSPQDVARQFVAFLGKTQTEYRVGFLEGLFTKINQIAPGIVSRALRGQLPKIRAALTAHQSTK